MVAAGAVVVRDVEPWVMVGGVPAKKIGVRPVVDGYQINARKVKVFFW